MVGELGDETVAAGVEFILAQTEAGEVAVDHLHEGRKIFGSSVALELTCVVVEAESHACLLALQIFAQVAVAVVVESDIHGSIGRIFDRGCLALVKSAAGVAGCHGLEDDFVGFEVGGFHHYFHTVGEGIFLCAPLLEFFHRFDFAGFGEFGDEGILTHFIFVRLELFGVDALNCCCELLFSRQCIALFFGYNGEEHAVVVGDYLRQYHVDLLNRECCSELVVELFLDLNAGGGIVVEEELYVFFDVRFVLHVVAALVGALYAGEEL